MTAGSARIATIRRDLLEHAIKAQRNGFVLEDVVDMPANNFSLVFRRGGGREAGG